MCNRATLCHEVSLSWRTAAVCRSRSTPWRWDSKDLRNFGILACHYAVSQPQDGGNKDLWNVGILPHHYMVSQPEDGGRNDLWNVGILPHHYTVSQPRRPRLESSSGFTKFGTKTTENAWDWMIRYRETEMSNISQLLYNVVSNIKVMQFIVSFLHVWPANKQTITFMLIAWSLWILILDLWRCYIRGYIQKFSDWVGNEINNNNNNKHSLRSNTKGYGGKTH
jgi:hypothetical protein